MVRESISSIFLIQNALLTARLAKRVGNRLFAHGISLNEYLVMHYLAGSPHKEVARIELADHLGMSASGVTRLLAPMEKNHIVDKTRNLRDARQSLVKLSKTGQRLYKEASVSFENCARDLTGGLTHSEQEKLLNLYRKVV